MVQIFPQDDSQIMSPPSEIYFGSPPTSASFWARKNPDLVSPQNGNTAKTSQFRLFAVNGVIRCRHYKVSNGANHVGIMHECSQVEETSVVPSLYVATQWGNGREAGRRKSVNCCDVLELGTEPQLHLMARSGISDVYVGLYKALWYKKHYILYMQSICRRSQTLTNPSHPIHCTLILSLSL